MFSGPASPAWCHLEGALLPGGRLNYVAVSIVQHRTVEVRGRHALPVAERCLVGSYAHQFQLGIMVDSLLQRRCLLLFLRLFVVVDDLPS